MDITINWGAQIAATLAALVIGAIWHSPLLFKASWASAVGMTPEKEQSANKPLKFGGAIVLVFILAFFLRVVILGHANGEFATFGHGAVHGIGMSLLVAIPIIGQKALFEQTSLKLYAINIGYWLITLTVMSAILSGWQ